MELFCVLRSLSLSSTRRHVRQKLIYLSFLAVGKTHPLVVPCSHMQFFGSSSGFSRQVYEPEAGGVEMLGAAELEVRCWWYPVLLSDFHRIWHLRSHPSLLLT